MDYYHTEEEMAKVVHDFLQKLADSGYNHPHMAEILRSGCGISFRRIIENITGGK